MRRIIVCVFLALCFFGGHPCEPLAKKQVKKTSQAKKTVKKAPARVYVYETRNLSPVSSQCIIDASERFDIPVSMILTILDVEGGEVGESAKNRNKTWDLGPMQINTCHLPRLKNYGITRNDLVVNGCLNIQVGTFLLKEHFTASKNRPLEAMGRYHSMNEPYKSRYKNRAKNAYKTLKANPSAHIDKVLKKANRRALLPSLASR